MYESRDMAFAKWLTTASLRRGYQLCGSGGRILLESAFNAGWEARKEAEYRTMCGRLTPFPSAFSEYVNYESEGSEVRYWISRGGDGRYVSDDCTWIVPGTHPDDPSRRT